MSAGLADCSLILSPTDCFHVGHKNTVTNLLRARAMDIGGHAFGVFGNDYDTDHKEIMASLAFNEMGETVHSLTRQSHEGNTTVLSCKLTPLHFNWGGFKKRKSFLSC